MCYSSTTTPTPPTKQMTLSCGRRSVQFNETVTFQFGTALDHPEALRSNIWFECREMRDMKNSATQLGRESCKLGLGALLFDVYGKGDAHSVANMESWAISCAHRRGLERFVSPDYAVRRAEYRRRNILSVLKAQERMRDQEKLQDHAYISLVIGRLSAALSKNARLFAHVMGKGDEKVFRSLNIAAIEKPAIVKRKLSPQSITDMMDPFFGMENSPQNFFEEVESTMVGQLI